MKDLIKLLILAAVVIGAWYLVTPWWTMKQIADAAEDGDAEALEELVDFEVLRANMRDDLRASRDDGDTGLLDQLGDNGSLHSDHPEVAQGLCGARLQAEHGRMTRRAAVEHAAGCGRG